MSTTLPPHRLIRLAVVLAVLGCSVLGCGGAGDPVLGPAAGTGTGPATPTPAGEPGSPSPTGGSETATADPTDGPGNGNTPPGVEHDIPEPGNGGLGQRSQWEEAVRSACEDADLLRDCLVLGYRITVPDPEGGDPRIVTDPDKVDPDKYDGCPVIDVLPPTGQDVLIPAGTPITVIIVCTSEDEPSPTPEVTPTPSPTPTPGPTPTPTAGS